MNHPYLKRICNYCLAVFLFITSTAYAEIWQSDTTSFRNSGAGHGGRFISDNYALRYLLNQVPNELTGQSLEIKLPMPDGSLAAYQIYESSIMQPGLAAKFPDIKSYIVRGIDHAGSYGRVDISPKGFRGMIYTPYGRVFIDPEQGSSTRYLSRTSRNQTPKEGFQCSAHDSGSNHSSLRSFEQNPVTRNRVSGSITSYRLAVSATPEYVAAVSTIGPSLSEAMSEINTAVNRVNQIYERDLGIRLFLVAGNDKLIDMQGSANFDNDSSLLLLDQNQEWIDSRIGSSSYDVGHIFSTSDGGSALLQSVCGSSKAQGATGLTNPTGDLFYIDFVAHELGHQFGANHTFNGSTGSCMTERNPDTAYEPGSGSTIMAYAGLCGGENLQSSSEATFHAGTIAEINAFVTNNLSGGSCSTNLATLPVNNDPTSADAGVDKTIPVNTSFRLVGEAVDADGDLLSYQWDQLDTGTVETTATTYNMDQGNNPLFRSYEPQPTAERHFPSLGNQLGLSSDVGEILPTTARLLNFRLTARDCKSGQATDDVRLIVDNFSGPFAITSHDGSGTATFVGTTQQFVSWNVANTALSPVNCANVDIDLLTFSVDKASYAVTSLASNVPNSGLAAVTIGDKSALNARFRVSCSDNVFYDISDSDLVIVGAIALPTTGYSTALSEGALCGDSNVVGEPTGVRSSSDDGGSGSPDRLFLALLLLLGTRRVYKKR